MTVLPSTLLVLCSRVTYINNNAVQICYIYIYRIMWVHGLLECSTLYKELAHNIVALCYFCNKNQVVEMATKRVQRPLVVLFLRVDLCCMWTADDKDWLTPDQCRGVSVCCVRLREKRLQLHSSHTGHAPIYIYSANFYSSHVGVFCVCVSLTD